MAKQSTAKRAKTTKTQASDAETPSGYFRRIIGEDRKLLKGRNNQVLLDRWLADHPGEKEVPKNIRAILSNVKSTMRSKRRRRKKAATAGANGPTTQISPAMLKGKGHKLERLEEQIDDVLGLARGMAGEGLEDIVKLLRRARNEVVWKMGQ
jgi:hypothetical protein